MAAASMSCAANPSGPSEVVGPLWRLVDIQKDGAAPIVVEDPSRYSLRFGEDGRAAVVSDCNSCGGSYSLTGSSLELGPLACTRAFCGERSLDSAYARGLEGTRTVSVVDDQLTIRGDGTALHFKR